jgi:EF hand
MTKLSHQVLLCTGAVVGSIALAACGHSTPGAAAAERIRPAYDKASGRLTRLEYDSNGDGKIDTWGYMDGMRVVRVEVDEDGDGKVDRWEFHKDAPTETASGGVDKTIERVERATRHDGKVSRWEYFDNGTLTRVEEDTDGDGQVDKWEQYSAGTLVTMAMDTGHTGKPDRRLVYRADGSLDYVEADPTGSGTFTRVAQ